MQQSRMPEKFDAEKFVNAVLFFAQETERESLGPLKLNKLLYYSDFLHFKKYGRPIIGDRYVRMPYGPVPSTAFAIFGLTAGKLGKKPVKTILTGKVEIKESKYKGKKISKIVALREPDLDVFSKSEIGIMKEVAQICRDLKLTGNKLSKLTHLPDSPWSKTEENQTIDYKLILDNSKQSIASDYVEFWDKEGDELDQLLSSPPHAVA